MYYGVLRNARREIKKVEIKKSHKIKKGTKYPDFNSLFRSTLKEVGEHVDGVPLFLRLLPTLVLSGIILILVV